MVDQASSSMTRTQFLRQKLGLPEAPPKMETGIGRMERLAKEDIARNQALTQKGTIGRFFSSAASVPKGAHNLIADTFMGKGGTSKTLMKGVTTDGLKAAGGYAAAGASGGVSAWLTHKFLPESIQGTLRKVAVGGAGIGGSFIPSLVKKFIFK